MKKFRTYSLYCVIVWTLAACSIHTVDIQQGNIITPEMVEQLKPGMTRQQVRFVMGTPSLVDTFHRDRWDYIYTLKDREGKREQKHVTLFFEGDELVRIQTDGISSEPPAGTPSNG